MIWLGKVPPIYQAMGDETATAMDRSMCWRSWPDCMSSRCRSLGASARPGATLARCYAWSISIPRRHAYSSRPTRKNTIRTRSPPSLQDLVNVEKMESKDYPCAHIFFVLYHLGVRIYPIIFVKARRTMDVKPVFRSSRTSNTHV